MQSKEHSPPAVVAVDLSESSVVGNFFSVKRTPSSATSSKEELERLNAPLFMVELCRGLRRLSESKRKSESHNNNSTRELNPKYSERKASVLVTNDGNATF